jgi:hypothetical protein
MKTTLFLLTSLISAGMIFSSCQKDNELASSIEQPKVSNSQADLSKPDASVISDLNTRITMTNYPDPFENETNILFTLQRPTKLRIYIHEVGTGKSELFFEGLKGKGTHALLFNARGKKPGEFIAELIAGNTVVKEIMYKVDDGTDDLNDRE